MTDATNNTQNLTAASCGSGGGAGCERTNTLSQHQQGYDQKVNEYVKALRYLQNTTAGNSESQTKAQKRVNELNKELNNRLRAIKNNIGDTKRDVDSFDKKIQQLADKIGENNNIISEQDNAIRLRNEELNSKNRQNEFSIERNQYRRIMLIILICVNIILIGLIIKFY